MRKLIIEKFETGEKLLDQTYATEELAMEDLRDELRDDFFEEDLDDFVDILSEPGHEQTLESNGLCITLIR